MATQVSLHGWVKEVTQEGFVLRASGRLVTVVHDLRELDLTRESVVAVRGQFSSEGRVEACEVRVINRCTRLPFAPAERERVSASVRARYRYLELRDAPVRHRFEQLHRFRQGGAHSLDQRRFISVDTPILARRSASGATEFLASGRSQRQWALPQSPQVYGSLAVLSDTINGRTVFGMRICARTGSRSSPSYTSRSHFRALSAG